MRFVVLALAAACAAAGSSATCGATGSLGLPCLPGTGPIGVGYDAVRGRTKVLPLVELTYAEKKQHTDPFTGVTYAVPDQVTVTEGTEQGAEHTVYRSVQEYAQAKSTSVGVSASGSFFSLSTDVSASSALFSSASAVLAVSRQRITAWEATLDPTPLLQPSSVLRRAAALLPTAYDAEAYADFVDTFGTHVVRLSAYGGEASIRTSVAQSFAAHSDDTAVKVQLQAQWAIFGGSGSVASNVSHSAAWNASGSTGVVDQKGGDPLVSWASNWTRWANSVFAAPVQVQVQLQDIAQLVPDAAIAANIAAAVSAYAAAHNSTLYPTVQTQQLKFCGCAAVEVVHGSAVQCPDPDAVLVDTPIDKINLHEGYEIMSTAKGQCCRLCRESDADVAAAELSPPPAAAGIAEADAAPRMDGLRHVAAPLRRVRGTARLLGDFPPGAPKLDNGAFSLCNCYPTSVVTSPSSSSDKSARCPRADTFPVSVSLGSIHLHAGYEIMDDASSICCAMCVGVSVPPSA